jgi:hypothetical protein
MTDITPAQTSAIVITKPEDADEAAETLDHYRAGIELASELPMTADPRRVVTLYAPRLIAALEVALGQHRRSPRPTYGPGADAAHGKHYCAGACNWSVDSYVNYQVWPCQPYQDITRALLGTDPSHPVPPQEEEKP